MLAFHRLSDDQFRSIAGGYGDEDALAELRASQLSKRLLLMHWIRAMTDDEAVALIDEVGRKRPDVVRDTLTQPFVDAWASSHGQLLESGTGGDPDGGAYFAGLAATVAVRAGVEAEVGVRTQPGQVVLPRIGLAYGLGAGPARVRWGDGRVVVSGPDRTVIAALEDPTDRPHWCPSRSVELGTVGTVVIDDLDPYRARLGMPLHPRLRPEEVDRLAVTLAEAWELITTDYPGHAATVRACLRSVVPLAAPPGGGSVSGTARRAFGAVAVSPQRDGAELALLLIHELQHVKYNAVVDLVDLVDPAHTTLYEAPWRADPRPASAVLTGAYAHTGVADYWRVRRHRTDGDAGRFARFEAAYWLEQTARSLETLAASDALTEPGARFVDALRATVVAWRGERTEDGVADLTTAVSVGWRLRNHQVLDSDLDPLVNAWRTGAARPPVPPCVVVAATPPGAALVDGPAARLREELGGPPFEAPATQPDDDHRKWVQLALGWRRAGRPAAARTIARRPDLVRALTHRLNNADPEEVAAWLDCDDQI
jgi:uncharacterized protein